MGHWHRHDSRRPNTTQTASAHLHEINSEVGGRFVDVLWIVTGNPADELLAVEDDDTEVYGHLVTVEPSEDEAPYDRVLRDAGWTITGKDIDKTGDPAWRLAR